MTFQEQLPFLKRLAKGLAEHFGGNCEVTVHDFTTDFENTLVAIENGHITGRKVGDGSSKLVLEALKADAHSVGDMCNYLSRTKDGRVLKSTSIFVRDGEDKVVGLLGINYDFSEVMLARNALEDLMHISEAEENGGAISITTNVNDLLDQLIEESVRYIGKPVSLMGKEDKVRAMQFLNERGAFLIKKAGDKVSKYYDISKYTLYNYLGAEA